VCNSLFKNSQEGINAFILDIIVVLLSWHKVAIYAAAAEVCGMLLKCQQMKKATNTSTSEVNAKLLEQISKCIQIITTR